MEADHTVRLHIGLINQVFLDAGAKAAIDRGYRTLHPSGAYVAFTQARCGPVRMMKCIFCADTRWVCENHPPTMEGPCGCDCAGAGMPPASPTE